MIDPSAHSGASGQSRQVQLQSQQSSSAFRIGKLTRVFAEHTAAGGSVVLRVGTVRVQATTLFPMRQGEWYVVRPEYVRGQMTLRVEQHLPRLMVPSEIARQTGLPQSDAALNLVRAFVRTGLPLESARLQQVYRRVFGSRREDDGDSRERARLAAILERKGIPADAALIGGILGDAALTGDREQGRDRKEHRDPPEERDVREAVHNAFRLDDEARSPLQLFNHLVGAGDHWVVIPIGMKGGRVATLRIRVPREHALGISTKSYPYSEALLITEWEGERVVFAIVPSEKGVNVTLLGEESKAPPSGLLAELRESMERIGGTLRTAEIARESHDGFSTADAPGIIASVDSSA